MTLYEEAIHLANRMTLVEKVRLLEHLSAALKQDIALEAYKHLPWEQFLDLTYGSLAGDPRARPAAVPRRAR